MSRTSAAGPRWANGWATCSGGRLPVSAPTAGFGSGRRDASSTSAAGPASSPPSSSSGAAESVAGIEPSPAAAEHARALGVEAIAGTLADAPGARASSTRSSSTTRSSTSTTPPARSKKLARLLRRGGLLAIAVPNFGQAAHRRLFGSAWFQLDLPRHLQHFDRDSLATLVQSAGLRPVETTAASMRPSPLGSLQCATFGNLRYEGAGFASSPGPSPRSYS